MHDTQALPPLTGLLAGAEPEVAPALPLGCPIYTSDGVELGTLKEVRDGAFKVDVVLHRDYWLHWCSIHLVTADRIELVCAADQLAAYKRARPS